MFRNRVFVLFTVAWLAFLAVGPVSAGSTPRPLQATYWVISGNTGVGGVTLSFYSNGLKTATSEPDGSYTLSVPDGWSGTVAPSKAGYVFTPAARNYASTPVTSDMTGQDFGAVLVNTNLSNLVLSSGALAPAFASGTHAYTSAVAFSVASLTVTPTAYDIYATITVNGITVASGSASGAIALNVGANTITIVVTGPNGANTVTYTVTVTRAASAFYADPAGLCGGYTPCYSSLQAALNASSAGGVVTVYGGTYTESVTLDRAVAITCTGDLTLTALSIARGAFTAPTGTLTLNGALAHTGGVFDANGGTVAFTGAATRILTATAPTQFSHLTVGSGVTLTTASLVTVTGALVNLGWTQETLPVAGAGALTFGLGSLCVDVTTAGSLTSLQVIRRDQNHPAASLATQTGKYWNITPTGAGYAVNLTLPHALSPDTLARVCRYTGTDWDCARAWSTTGSVTRMGISQLSDWVVGMNLAPVAAGNVYTTPQDTTLIVHAPGVLGNDSDPNGDLLFAALGSQPAHGQAALASNGALMYLPAVGFVGQDAFDYIASDGALTATARVTITVTTVNHLVVARDDIAVTREDEMLVVPAPGVLSNDADPDGDPLTAELLAAPFTGTATLAANGAYTYTPPLDFNDVVSFTYRVRDAGNLSATATVYILVQAVNDAPTFAKGADQSVNQGAGAQTVTGWATALSAGPANESGQTLAFNVTTAQTALFVVQPTVDVSGTLHYTPAANANGVATATVTLRDNGGMAHGGVDTSAPQTLAIAIKPWYQLYLPLVLRQQ